MVKRKEMSGLKFGRLLVISESHKDSAKNAYFWNCLCDCGNKIKANGNTLRRGHKKSCGCLQKENARKINKTHGLSGSRIENIYDGMKARCNRPSHEAYHRYGGRGIKICEEWNDLESFVNWASTNGYKESLTIERIDVNGNYEPSNCKWIKKEEQYFNRRIPVTNKSGYVGVLYMKNRNKFLATLNVGRTRGGSQYIGHYSTFMEAYNARRAKELEIYGKYLYSEPNLEEVRKLYPPELFE